MTATTPQVKFKRGCPTKFRDTFQQFLAALRFGPGSYLPHSLRRGGATWYYQATLSLDATVVRGRLAVPRQPELTLTPGRFNWHICPGRRNRPISSANGGDEALGCGFASEKDAWFGLRRQQKGSLIHKNLMRFFNPFFLVF